MTFFLGVIFSIFIVCLFFFPKIISFQNFKKYSTVYFILILLLIEWFWNHPALRYGGFVLVFLVMTFPFAILLSNQKFSFKKKLLQIKLILLIIFIVFSFRNIDRLINEYNIYNYNFLKNPNYLIDRNFYNMQNIKRKLFKDPNKVIKDLNLNINLRPQNLSKETFYKICLIYEKLIQQ